MSVRQMDVLAGFAGKKSELQKVWNALFIDSLYRHSVRIFFFSVKNT